MKKKIPKLMSAILAILMVLSAIPMTAFAAPASDLPANMTDHSILRALEYTGYDVQKQKNDGTLYQPSFFNLKIADSNERVILFSESVDESRQTFKKVVIKTADTLTIGRTNDNNLCYENKFVSSKHAKLSYDGHSWSILDQGSTNGTYVNGYKVDSKNLSAGDHIYIMGLRIVVGHSFIAINNPDGLLEINAKSLADYKAQVANTDIESIDLPDKEYFFRSPRFHREVEHTEIKIDPPPQLQKMDTVPLALMLGPSLTMGMTSISTGLLSVSNVISNGGEITQALPTLMMSVSMLLGTVLWPILTKKYEKKQKLKNEKKRQDKYLAYLDNIRDEIKRKCKEQSDILSENFVSPEECADRIAEESTKLWERVNGQSDFLKLRLGLGNLPLDADVKYSEKKFTMEDDNLQDATASVSKGEIVGITVTPYADKVYDGEAHDAVVVEGTKEGDTVTFSTDDIDYSASVPTIETPGSLTVYVKIVRNDKYEEYKQSFEASVVNATIQGVVVKPYIGVYDKVEHPAVTVEGTKEGDIITFSTDGTNYSDVVPTIQDVGTKDVHVKVQRAYHDDLPTPPAELKVTATVSQAEIEGVNATGYSAKYDKSSHDAITSVTGTIEGDVVTYSNRENGTYTSTVPTVKYVINSGTYYVKIHRNDNYKDLIIPVTVSIV